MESSDAENTIKSLIVNIEENFFNFENLKEEEAKINSKIDELKPLWYKNKKK